MYKNNNLAYQTDVSEGDSLTSSSSTYGTKKLRFFLICHLVVVFSVVSYSHFKSKTSEEIVDQGFLAQEFIVKHHKGPRFSLDQLLLNINSSSGSFIASLDMELFLNKSSAQTEINNLEKQLRDFALMIISANLLDDFSDQRQINFLQNKLKIQLNNFLTEGEIVQVYLKNFKRI